MLFALSTKVIVLNKRMQIKIQIDLASLNGAKGFKCTNDDQIPTQPQLQKESYRPSIAMNEPSSERTMGKVRTTLSALIPP